MVQWRSEGPAGPATAGGPAGLKGPARARQEEVVAVTPWPGARTSCLRGGPKIVATPLRWCRITKRDTFGWRDASRCPTVRISRQEKMVFESSSESRKSWDGRKMTRQCIPNFWCDRRAVSSSPETVWNFELQIVQSGV